MGQNRGNDDDDDGIFRKRTPSFPCYESIVQRNAQSKGGGKLSVLFCADGETIETVFQTNFLLISSVCTEQFEVCVKNAKTAV